MFLPVCVPGVAGHVCAGAGVQRRVEGGSMSNCGPIRGAPQSCTEDLSGEGDRAQETGGGLALSGLMALPGGIWLPTAGACDLKPQTPHVCPHPTPQNRGAHQSALFMKEHTRKYFRNLKAL